MDSDRSREHGHCWEIDNSGQCCSPASVSEESSLDWDLSLSTGSRNKQRTGNCPSSQAAQVANQCLENSAVYFLWPPVYRPHGSAEERESHFQGLQKLAGFTSTQRATKGQQASTLLDLMTIRAYNSKLLLCQGILGTAVGFRTRKGVRTNIPAIIVLVAHKIHTVWLDKSLRLPVHLEGPGGIWCDVDVVEFYNYGAPAFTPTELVYTDLAEGLRGNNPYISPGSQVATQESIGTLGAIVRSRTGGRQVGFLTNRHVAVNLDYPSQKMYHPLPPPVGPGVYLGAVERATSFITDEGWYSIFASTNPETFVRADGAFIPFAESFDLSRVRTSVDGIGEIGDVINIDLQAPVSSIVGKKVAKVGRSSGLTKGTITAYALEFNDDKGICFLTDFLIVGENKQAFDLEGDSGSLILMTEDTDKKKPRPVGIIWGGTANQGRLKLRSDLGPEKWTTSVDLGRLLEWLQLDLITSQTGLEEAIEEQRSKTIGVAQAEGSPRSPPLGIESDAFLARMRRTPGHHCSEHGEGQLHSVNEAQPAHPFSPVSCSKPPDDTTPINFIRELDFGIKPSGGAELESMQQRKPAGMDTLSSQDVSLDLLLQEKDAKRRRQ